MRGIDEEKLVQALREHAPYLRRFLLSRGASADDVDDLVQDTFVVAWQKREVILDGKARQYLTSVARCILMAHRRKNGTRKNLMNQNRAEVVREVHPDEPKDTIEKQDTIAERERHLRQCLKTLPTTYRKVLELIHLRGMPREAVAVEVGCSLNALYVRELRAVRSLSRAYFSSKTDEAS